MNKNKDLIASYDEVAKELLSHKQFLAIIMKHCVYEFKDYEVKDIIPCIENDIETGSAKVEEGLSNNKIKGNNTESAVLNEGKVFYDIIFHARTSDEESIEVIINIEIQRNYHPGYDLVSRAIYYCSRMISSQAQREFSLSRSEYDKIKKVYSIWICVNVPEELENTISTYKYNHTFISCDSNGKTKDKDSVKGRYDLAEIDIIRLGKDLNSGNELQRFLKVLLSSGLSKEERKEILVDDYQIEFNEKTEEDVNTMCNLGEGLWEEAEAKGKAEGKEEGLVQGKEEERKKNISCLAEYIMSSEGLSREDAENKARDIFSNNANNGALVM